MVVMLCSGDEERAILIWQGEMEVGEMGASR